jgi:hypothetical protein
MDVAAVASAAIAAKAGQTQMAVAAKMMKMNQNHSAEIVQMIDASQQNLAKLSGLGQNLDISV